jgi:creatinine amidohydrolase
VKICEMNWKQVEDYLQRDDRAVLPIGSTEQHAQLSLCVDTILAERVAIEAAEPLKVPVFPVLPYGLTSYFMAFPGTVTLSAETYARVLHEILGSMMSHGFKRIVVVNGHGGNVPAQAVITECLRMNPNVRMKLHNWWNAPATWVKVQETDSVASHASWMENFPWTRLEDVKYPAERKSMIDVALMRAMAPEGVRKYLGDGNFGGYYQRPDEEMLAIWRTGVEETRRVIAEDWP